MSVRRASAEGVRHAGCNRRRAVPPADRLRRKLTVRAHGRTLVLVKRAEESGEHVVQKALLWTLYLPRFPGLHVEQALPFPSRFKPDLYALDATGRAATFWGECGVTSREKLGRLLRDYPSTHFVFSKWQVSLHHFAALVDDALDGVRRRAPVELVRVPEDAADWFAGSEPAVDEELLDWRRWDPNGRA